MSFANREEAAERLLRELERRHLGPRPLVLGIPRGSLPMARIIADRLGGELDVVLVHKIGAPGEPEFAIGSVSEFGTLQLSDAAKALEIPTEYIEAAAREQIAKLRERRRRYSPLRPPISPEGRDVIIVDDGIATGMTMLAAVRATRARNPRSIAVASPVASVQALRSLRAEADEVVVVGAPEYFISISQFYGDFPQIEDEEVLRVLSRPRGDAA